MSVNLSLKIDVKKIDKSRLHVGEKGTYLDAVIIMKDEPDEYGNIGMIVESVTKEEKAAGKKGAILGNAKRIGAKAHQGQTASAAEDDDLPF